MPSPKLVQHLRLPVSALVAVTVASCSLPPRDAWRNIQSRGLISYYMSQNAAPLSSSPTTRSAPLQRPGSASYASASSAPVQPRIDTPPPSQINNLPTAQPVADLPGYVRTPYTSPPRLVDVRGMSPGSKVVCPYTQKPFLVPTGVRSAPSVASSAPSRPAPRTNVREQAPTTPPRSTPKTDVAAMTKPTPEPKIEPTPAPPPPSDAAASLPYGSAIPGRPGFVNSPYAAKHQLVDVTGLPVGMEVKCPYTGKLFRVPPQ